MQDPASDADSEPEFTHVDRHHADAAMNYVDADALKGTLGFKPVCPYSQDRRVQTEGLFGSSIVEGIPGFEELPTLLARVKERALDGRVVYRLYSGLDNVHDAAGTAVPLTPPRSGTVLAVTAEHNLKEPMEAMSCTDSVAATWYSVPPDRRMPVRDVTPGVLPADVLTAAASLHKPHSPRANLGAYKNADLALLEVSCDRGSALHHDFYVPEAGTSQAGQNVGLIAYHGRVSYVWGREYLMVPSDVPHDASPDTPIPLLSDKEGMRRVEVLRDVCIYTGQQTFAPGRVHLANAEVVEHTCSVVPGCSGGAGVDMDRPWLLKFIHIRSRVNPRKAWSFGVSVSHPVFAYMYLSTVLPRLALVENLGREKVEAIHAYVDQHQGRHTAWGVADAVALFRSKHVK